MKKFHGMEAECGPKTTNSAEKRNFVLSVLSDGGNGSEFPDILAFKIKLVVPRNTIAAGFDADTFEQAGSVPQRAELRPAVHEGTNVETPDFAIAKNGVERAYAGRLDRLNAMVHG